MRKGLFRAGLGRMVLPLALCAGLFATPAFPRPAQSDAPPAGWAGCAGGTGLSTPAQIARCTAIIDSKASTAHWRAAALRSRCLLYSEDGKHRQAIADCGRAVALDPGNPESYRVRGNAWRNAGEFDPAIADFTHALALKPASPGILTLRGLAYSQKGEYDLAIADYTQALKYWPELRLAQSLLVRAKAAKANRAHASPSAAGR